MSTRCNIIIKDAASKLVFYRHSDGYPEGTMPLLKKFLDLVKRDKIRDNVNQAAGWLIILGAIEYQTISGNLFSEADKEYTEREDDKIDKSLKNFIPKDWKCGAFEPTVGIHGDIDWLYVIDLKTKKITKTNNGNK